MTEPEPDGEPLPDRFSTDYPVIVTAKPDGDTGSTEEDA